VKRGEARPLAILFHPAAVVVSTFSDPSFLEAQLVTKEERQTSTAFVGGSQIAKEYAPLCGPQIATSQTCNREAPNNEMNSIPSDENQTSPATAVL
jgi:hypothetical protein